MIGVQNEVTTLQEPHVSEQQKSSHAELFAWRDDAYLLALRLTGHPADAEDIVQEAYLRALRHEGQIPAGIEGRHWFQRVVINTARDRRSAESSRKARERSAAMEQNTRADSRVNELQSLDDLRGALAVAMNTLDEHLRAILCLHYEQDISYAKAAELLGENEGTLRANASRGIALLREKLSRAGYTVAPAIVVSTLAAGLGIKTSAAFAASVEFILSTGSLPPAVAAHGVAGKAAAVKNTAISVSVKTALLAGVVLAVLITVTAAKHFNDRADSPKAEADSRSAGVPPETGAGETPVVREPDKELAEILGKKIDAVCRRDFLSEVLDDLNKRVGLRSAFPKRIDKAFEFTLDEKKITVKQVLEKLAAEGKLDLEYRGDTVVFWKKADEKILAELEKKLKNGDVEARLEAIYDLVHLGDPRIYPMLLDVLQKNNDAVSAEVLLLADEHADTLCYCKNISLIVEPIQKLLSTPAYKRDAAILLGASRDEHAVGPLIPLLNDADPGVRHAAATALGQIRDPRATEPLIALLKADDGKADDVRHAVATALGQIRDPRATDPLMALLKDENVNVRETAASALGQGRDPRAIGLLIVLLKDADPQIRLLAGAALGQSRDPRATDPLIAMLNDTDAIQRSYWACYLGQIGDPRATDPLIALLKDADADVRLSAVIALGQMHDPRSIDPLIALLKDGDARLRRTVAEAMGDLRVPRATDALIALLNDNDDIICYLAGSALSRSRDPRGIDSLIALLKNANDATQRLVAASLQNSRDPRAIDPLATLLKSANNNTQLFAASAMAQIRDPRGTELLAALLRDPDANIRFSAIALCQSRDPLAIDPLVALLKDPDINVRCAASFALSLICDSNNTAPLVALLKDDNANARAYAAATLIRIRDPRATTSLIALLKDAAANIRNFAVAALGQSRDPRAIVSVIPLLQDPDPIVRSSTAATLGQSRDSLATVPAIASLKEAGVFTRMVAAYTLMYYADAFTTAGLNALLKDPAAWVRVNATASFDRNRNPGATDSLLLLLKDIDVNVRDSAASILIRVGDPRAKKMLREYEKSRQQPKPVKPPTPPPSGDF